MKIVLVDFTPDQLAEIGNRFPDTEFLPVSRADEVSVLEADALVASNRGAFDAVFVPSNYERWTTIRWYHAPGAGVDSYMFQGLASMPFTLTCGKIIQGPEVADHALALLLALTRRLHRAFAGQTLSDFPARPVELRGKRAVVIGAGGVGLCVAERLRGFGARVDVVTEDNLPLVTLFERRWLSDQLHEALAGADIVIGAAPWTRRSENLLDDTAFAAMKEGAYLVNVSRGGIIDTEALHRAVKAGKLAGVGLDVTNPEPLPDDHPLFSCPDVIITPHLAGPSDNLRERNFELICTNIRRFVGELPLINVVDKKEGY